MRTRIVCAVIFLSSLIHPLSSLAQPPPLINYQGRLVDGTNLVNAIVPMAFRIYTNEVGGAHVFESTNLITVVDGLYATAIGEHVTVGSLNEALWNPAVWLEVVVDGTPLAPRERILTVPFAWMTHGLRVTDNDSIILNPLGDNAIPGGVSGAVIGGGDLNSASAPYATIGGGSGNFNSGSGATIGGGIDNIVGGGQNATIAGGEFNQALAQLVSIGGGQDNIASEEGATVSGGVNNTASNGFATVGGGLLNVAGGGASTVAGGSNNHAREAQSAVGGGVNNAADGLRSVVGGGEANSAVASYSTVGGGQQNTAGHTNATVSGGWNNTASAVDTTVGGGRDNVANASGAAIGGGSFNTAGGGSAATVGGGMDNTAGNFGATVGGGWQNQAAGDGSTVGGGLFNVASNQSSTVAGGDSNIAGNQYATVPGGLANTAGGAYSLAAGRRAKALHNGAFVWGDSTSSDVLSTNINSVTMRADGGYRLFSNSGMTLGAQLPPNATAWEAISDREAKENIEPIDTAEILDRLANMPITAWTYKADPNHRRYIGPMAQDFRAAFGLGDDKTISTLDADGVAFAAIQALKRENEALRAELEAIKKHLGM